MRHGIVGTGLLVLALTFGSWFFGATPDARGERADVSAAVVLELAEVAPPATAPPATAPPATAPPAPTSTVAADEAVTVDDAASFLADVNRRRAREGLASLTRRAELDDLAQSWAATIAADDSLRHSELIHDIIAGAWTTAGENVGYGPSAAVIFNALEASPGHLANMVNPDFTSMGIGVVRVGDVLWTAHLFAG